jgi:tetratricopeptide (TPR) repeat protein
MVLLAGHYYRKGDFTTCLDWAENALLIKEKKLDYIVEEFAWGFEVYDYAAISAWNLGLVDQAREYGKKALELNPTDARLQRNLEFYEGDR